MDFVIVALLVLLLILAYLNGKGQRFPEALPNRKVLVYTMVRFDTLEGSIFGPFECHKTVQLNFIPQVGIDIEIFDLRIVQQVFRVYYGWGDFSLGLTKHTFSDWSEGDEPSEAKFLSYLESQGWEATKISKHRRQRDWEDWPDYKPAEEQWRLNC